MINNQDLTGFRNLLGLYYCHAMLPNDCIVWASTPLSHRLIKPRERTRAIAGSRFYLLRHKALCLYSSGSSLSLLTLYSLPLTPHPLLLTLHSSLLTPHFLPFTLNLSLMRRSPSHRFHHLVELIIGSDLLRSLN